MSRSSNRRVFDGVKVAAECLGMNYDVDFDIEKRVALHHYHPKVAQYFYEPGTKSRKQRKEILIPKTLAVEEL